jgi:hypothetical protein
VELRDGYEQQLREFLSTPMGRSLGADNSGFADVAWSALTRLCSWPLSAVPDIVFVPYMTLPTYRNELLHLCDIWGLRCSWAAPWLHAAIIEWVERERLGLAKLGFTVRRHGRSGGYWGGPSELTLNIGVSDWETWEQFSARLLKLSKPQWEQSMADWAQRSGWQWYDTRPQLSTHIRWLYLRICPQDHEGPWGWAKIGKREHASITTVRNEVLSLAKDLEIDLRPIPRGRPRK